MFIYIGQCVQTLKGHSGGVASLTWLDNNILASGSTDMNVRAWEVTFDSCLHTFSQKFRRYNELLVTTFTTQSQSLLITASENHYHVWSVITGDLIHEGYRNTKSLQPLKDDMFASGHHGYINIWILKNNKWKIIKKILGYKSYITCMANLDGNRLVSADHDGTIQIYNFKNSQLQTIRSKELDDSFRISSLSLIGEYNLLVEATNDLVFRAIFQVSKKQIFILNIDTGDILFQMQGILWLVLLENNEQMAMSFEDGSIKIYSCATSFECLNTMSGHFNKSCVLESLGNGHLASGSDDKIVRIWNIATGKCEHQLCAHVHEITCLKSVGDKRLVSGSRDGEIYIWDTETGEMLQSLIGHFDEITSFHLIENDKLASASKDLTVKIWNIKNSPNLQVLKGHHGEVHHLLFLGDDLLASGSYDNSVRIWTVTNGKCIRHIVHKHMQPINCMRLLSDGQFASGSRDGSILIADAKSNGLCFWLVEPTNCVCGSSELGPSENNQSSATKEINSWKFRMECSFFAPYHKQKLIGIGRDGVIRIWDISKRTCDCEIKTNYVNVGSKWIEFELHFLGDNKIAIGLKTEIQIWNLKEKNCVKIMQMPMQEITVRLISVGVGKNTNMR